MPRRKLPETRKSNNTVWIVAGVIGALAFVGALIWLAQSSAAPVPAPKAAAGKTWGSAGAPVVLEEYADFQ